MRPTRDIWFLRALVTLGLLALSYYLSWWHRHDLGSFWYMLAFVTIGAFSTVQIIGNWLIYLLAADHPTSAPWPRGMTVDVFVTAYREPRALIERTLAAACAMEGEHRTWLLDDSNDPELAALAMQLGAGYLTRPDCRDAKAGNLNAALARTAADIIVIFDADHAPRPDFLQKTIGYFSDPKIGFTQVMLTFSNQSEHWVARASAESSVDFYNPVAKGMHRLGSASLMGSNAIIRRAALESIGGYQPGLAEDLATSITLHAKGWHSIYVAEPLAPGESPADLPAWFTQQLKWARGVFEVLLTAYPRLWSSLSWSQRLAYAVRMTYYWLGPLVGAHLLLTAAVLMSRNPAALDLYRHYLSHAAPLCFLYLCIRQVALRSWRHPSVAATLFWRAIALVYLTWPIYSAAWLMTLFRLPLRFRPTPRVRHRSIHPGWMAPHLLMFLFLTVAGFRAYPQLVTQPPLLVVFLLLQYIPQLALVCYWVQTMIRRPPGTLAITTLGEGSREVRSYGGPLP